MPKRARPSKRRGKAQVPPREFTREDVRWLEQALHQPPPSTRGRKIDPRLHEAWIEWEAAAPAKKPTYQYLAQRFYGNGQRYRETVKKGIERLHRRLGQKLRRPS
jgi:hypothetical protein